MNENAHSKVIAIVFVTATFALVPCSPSVDAAPAAASLELYGTLHAMGVIISPTRARTLTGLSNYSRYTVTLSAMLNNTPFLTDTVTAMPTDIFVYLPLLLKN